MTKSKGARRPEQYTPEEFDQVVGIIRADAQVRADIEAITGQPLEGRSPRELFNLFRAIHEAAAVQEAVARYGRARRTLRAVRAELAADRVAELEAGLADNPDVNELAARRIHELEAKLDKAKAENRRLKQSNKAIAAGAPVAPRVIPGKVGA